MDTKILNDIRVVARNMTSVRNTIKDNLTAMYNIKPFLDLSDTCGGIETLHSAISLKHIFNIALAKFNNNCLEYERAYKRGNELLDTLNEEQLWEIPNEEHIINTHISQLIQQLNSEILYRH